MATETLILRPDASTGLDNIGYINGVQDTTISGTDYYKLVSEEISDEDATYASPTTATNSLFLHFTMPEEYKELTATNAKVVVRGCIKDSSNEYESVNVATPTAINSSNNTLTLTSLENVSFNSIYTDYIWTIPDDVFSIFIETLQDSSSMQIRVQTSDSSTKNSTHVIAVTQVYIELTFEKEAEEPSFTNNLYLKINNEWTPIMNALIYKKVNGEWEPSDISIFTDNQKFILNNE